MMRIPEFSPNFNLYLKFCFSFFFTKIFFGTKQSWGISGTFDRKVIFHLDPPKCAQVCTSANKCEQVCTSVHKCEQVCTSVHKCAQVCTSVNKCAQVCRSVPPPQVCISVHTCSH